MSRVQTRPAPSLCLYSTPIQTGTPVWTRKVTRTRWKLAAANQGLSTRCSTTCRLLSDQTKANSNTEKSNSSRMYITAHKISTAAIQMWVNTDICTESRDWLVPDAQLVVKASENQAAYWSEERASRRSSGVSGSNILDWTYVDL